MRQRAIQILVAGIVVTSALATLWAPATADLTWTPPVNVSDPGVFPAVTLSGDHSGAIAAWITTQGPNDTVQAATFNGTQWAAPLNVDGPGLIGGLQVTGDNSGAVATWGLVDQVRVASFDGASWSAPITLASGSEMKISGGLDTAVVVWAASGSAEILAATFDGSAWSAPLTDRAGLLP